jgi:hypothetical protein
MEMEREERRQQGSLSAFHFLGCCFSALALRFARLPPGWSASASADRARALRSPQHGIVDVDVDVESCVLCHKLRASDFGLCCGVSKPIKQISFAIIDHTIIAIISR